jgi:hypothetical protein
MYTTLLLLHSILRWLVLLAGLLAFARGLSGWSGASPWTPSDARAGAWFARALDVQMLLGLILYFGLSPITRAALQDFGAAMGNSALRYFAVEHVFGMLVAITLAHVGVARIRKTTDERRRHRVAAVFFGLALVAILVSIPWPGLPNGRPLLRLTW